MMLSIYENPMSSVKSNEKTTNCFFGKIFYLYREHKSWQDSWAQLPRSPSWFHFSTGIEDLKTDVEIHRKRRQGTVWNILELPSLTLGGEKHDLILSAGSNKRPLEDFYQIKRCPKTLLRIYDWFESQLMTGSFRTFVIDKADGEIEPAHLPFCHHSSSSEGKRTGLQWTTWPVNDWDLEPIMKYVSAFNIELQKAFVAAHADRRRRWRARHFGLGTGPQVGSIQ